MTAGWLPAPVQDLFGDDAALDESYDVLTVDVPPSTWLTALDTARTTLNCTYFDWLSAVDEPGTGFRVCAHVVALAPVRRLLLRTTVPHTSAELPTAVGVYAGAAWHERETHEMFGVTFTDHPSLTHLLLPDTFEGHPLRKDFVLVARAAKPWPGAKEPGESDHGAPKRRQTLPPGVPDPNEWGPLKGQLPAPPPRPARSAAGAAAGSGAPADRPVRRTRSASQGSASQTGPTAPLAPPAQASTPADRPPRRNRSASQGSASQTPPAAAPPATPVPPAPPATPADRPARRNRSASQGSASQSPDAPWHHARPAFDEAEPPAEPAPPAPPPAATGEDDTPTDRPTDAGGPQ